MKVDRGPTWRMRAVSEYRDTQPIRVIRKTSNRIPTHRISIETSKERGGELRDTSPGVMLALFDDSGNCIVENILPTHNRNTCDEDEIPLNLFDRGTRETIEIEAPGLGNIERVWIAPASGTWFPEDIAVENIKEKSVSTFSNSTLIGERQRQNAVELSIAKPTAVSASYTGDQAFKELKGSLLVADALLVVIGTAALYFLREPVDAATFGAGGAVGFLYLVLLSSSVESIGQDTGSVSIWKTALSFPATRLLFVLGATYVIIQKTQALDANPAIFTSIVEAVSGLLMYKLSVLFINSLENNPK